MYVILPNLWAEETFPENHFLIKTEEQLRKIEGLALKEVSIDTVRGVDNASQPLHGEVPPSEWDTSAGITERIKDLVTDNKL